MLSTLSSDVQVVQQHRGKSLPSRILPFCVALAVGAALIGIVGLRESKEVAAAPTALINIYTTDGYGTYRSCYRTSSGSQSVYYCRDLTYESVGYVPTFAKGKSEIAPGNWTITSASGTTYEGCTNPATGFTCAARASSISIKSYDSNPWYLYGSALKTTFINTGTAAECLYALYHFDPDITACL
jgi:hypothetical protein